VHRWRFWIGALISLVCLALALVGIEWDQAHVALHQADWRYLLPAGGLFLAYLLARAIRWRILLGTEISLAHTFAVTNIGYLVSNVLPFRLGDPARAIAIGLKGGVKTSAALSTVVVERVLDMLTVVLLLAATVPFVGQVGWTREASILAGGVALAALVVLVALAQRPDWGRRALQWSLARVPHVELGQRERWAEMLGGLLEGLAALRSARHAAGLAAWSVVTWACAVGYNFSILWAFLDRPSLIAASFLTCATGLGMALPSSPGAIGVFHSIARYALQLPFGVLEEKAVVVAFASHAFQYVTVCLLGLIGLLRQNLSLDQLRADAATTLIK
jgi:uncharacterized protein (TIRG00374 family)